MPSFHTVILATCTVVLAASSVSAGSAGSPNRLVRVRRALDSALSNAGAEDGTNKNTLHMGIGWMQRDLSDAESPADELSRTDGMKVEEPAAASANPVETPSEPEIHSEASADELAALHSLGSYWNTSGVAPLERQDSTPGDALKVAKEIKRLGAIQKHSLP
ncbi:hypothetical protein RQP46_000630 [Phenoliferia psychrophenolica]